MVDSINGSSNPEYAALVMQTMSAGKAIQANAEISNQEMKVERTNEQYDAKQAKLEEMNAELSEYIRDTEMPDYSTVSYSV